MFWVENVDVITTSQKFLSQCKTIFLGLLQIFYSKLSHTHYRIVFIPRTHETRFLAFILRSVHSFTLVLDLSVAWQQQQFTFPALR